MLTSITRVASLLVLFRAAAFNEVSALGTGYIEDGKHTYCWSIPQGVTETKLERTLKYEDASCPLKMELELGQEAAVVDSDLEATWTIHIDSSSKNDIGVEAYYVRSTGNPNEPESQIVHSNIHSCVQGSGCDPFHDGKELEHKTANQVANFTDGKVIFKEKIKFRKEGFYSVLAHITIPGYDPSSSRYDFAVYKELQVKQPTLSVPVIVGIAVGALIFVGLVIALVLARRRRNGDRLDDLENQTPMIDKTNNTSRTAEETMLSPATRTHMSALWMDPVLMRLHINADEIQDERKIGSGAFGVVWLSSYRGKKVAIKRLRAVDLSPKLIDNFVDEVKLCATLKHPCIVGLLGVTFTTKFDLQALFEYMPNGDLRSYLEKESTPSGMSPEKLQIAIDIADAFVYVHSFEPPLVHRDLKSHNVLLDEAMRGKLSDFGVSRFHSDNATMTQGVGTARWLAPEIIAGRGDYNELSDIFAFGVLLSELDTNQIPYRDLRGPNNNKLPEVAIIQMVVEGKLQPSFNEDCDPVLLELATECLALEPSERPSAMQVAFRLRNLLNATTLA